MHPLYKALMVASYLTLVSCQSTRQSNIRSGSRSRTAASSNLGQGRTLGLIRPLIGGLTGLGLGGLAGDTLQSDPIYGGGYPSYGGAYGGYGGYGGFPILGALFGGYSPFAYRPRPYYPLYGGYNPYAGYQRPSYSGGLSPSSSTSTSGLGSSSGSTAGQAQLANQLGQVLGASLRPLLTAGVGGSGAGAAGGAGGLASLLGLLG